MRFINQVITLSWMKQQQFGMDRVAPLALACYSLKEFFRKTLPASWRVGNT
jgi:hypothetical protein